MSMQRTVTGRATHEIPKIKGSRFLAIAEPIAAEEQAREVLQQCREQYRDATHHCWAWRLSPGQDRFRFSDDGEPSGTAGRPILREIDGRQLSDLMVVVVRYYGGTKLGSGGLIRAYGGAAGALLDRADIVERPVVRNLELLFPYELTGPVQAVLSAGSLEPSAAEYGQEVCLQVAPAAEQAESLLAALREATAGRIKISEPRP